MDNSSIPETAIKDLALPLERDVFLRTLIRELTGTLQDVVGLDEAAGLISIVGQRIGDQINESYRSALGVERLSRTQVAETLVDLQRRIQGDFYVIEQTDDRWLCKQSRRRYRFSATFEGVEDRLGIA